MTRQLVDAREAMRRLSIGRTKLNEITMTGELATVKIGSRRLFPDDCISAYIDRLTQTPPHQEGDPQ